MKKLENRVVIVTRETRLKKVLASQNTVSQAKFYINSLGGDFDEYEAEHRQYDASLRQIRQDLDVLANVQMLDREYLPNFIFAPRDIVVVIGQDGLVANTLKYLSAQPLVGVNPDPARWDGVLLPFTPQNAARIVEETAAGKRKCEAVSMARVRVQNGQELLAVNDFFIGQKTHTSARYIIKYGGVREQQSSSGIIVSTGMGSTGWMKSVIAGARRLSSSVIGRPYGSGQERDLAEDDDEEKIASEMSEQVRRVVPVAARAVRKMREDRASRENYIGALEQVKRIRKPRREYGPSELSSIVGKWSSPDLLFAVREPFPSKSTGTALVFGKISGREPLRIESLMGENGVIFSDGIESDFIAFNSGTEALISPADKKGVIVI
jgi:NAD kinase